MFQRNGRSSRKMGLIALICTFVLFIGVLIAIQLLDKPAAMGEDEEEITVTGLVEWNGKKWRKNGDIETILLIGYDKDAPLLSEMQMNGARDGGCADFLLLLVVDHGREEIRMLQLDRDTMTSVRTMSETGLPTGSKRMNICLAHAYGKNLEACDKNTETAVLGLLKGAWIDWRISTNIAGIPKINQLLGGVKMVIPEDLTDLAEMEIPEELGSMESGEVSVLTAGREVVLTDNQALLVCRARRRVGDGSNTARMSRQKEFMKAAVKQMQAKIKEDTSFATEMVEGVSDLANMSMDQAWIINSLLEVYDYDIHDPYILPSTHGTRRVNKGNNQSYDIVECEVKPEDITKWVMENLYVEYGV